MERRGSVDDGRQGDAAPTDVKLAEWLRAQRGTRTGTFTFNGVTYTDMNEVEWRRANNLWRKAQ